MKKTILSSCALLCVVCASAQELTLRITKQYLNFPVSQQVDRRKMILSADGLDSRSFVIRLADAEPQYWVFSDMTPYKGKTVTIRYEGAPEALTKIYQSDQIAGSDSLYMEVRRPQVHFSTRRGWINDPNGLICHDGEYHLFYQHNPYEREWENMHWGHAVSHDLLRWEELPDALYPDQHGTMFSGSAVVDYDNTAGFNKGETPAMVAIYTAAGERQTQCVAYSLDKGRTWTKYEGNPVIDSKSQWDSQDTRDPKVFWYAPSKHWVMVLNERDGHSIYTSSDLKKWDYQSHTTGFWECPELFELPVDGDPNTTKWVMYGASGTYMLGSFDGKTFTPEAGKYQYITGKNYAAQTYAGIPTSDGRRLQIGWGRLDNPGMPFNGIMMFPTELTLRTTREGVRLHSRPIREIETIKGAAVVKKDIPAAEAEAILSKFPGREPLWIKLTLTPHEATDCGLRYNGETLLLYDMNFNMVNGVFYTPERIDSKSITAEILLDRTSVEVWIDGGRYSYSMDRPAEDRNKDLFRIFGNKVKVDLLEVAPLRSIWR